MNESIMAAKIVSFTTVIKLCNLQQLKNFEDIFIRFDVIHERDRQTDRQTDTGSQHIPRFAVYAVTR